MTRAKAQAMEEAFLSGLEDAQVAYEAIVESEAWLDLGYETFAGWWSQRVQPTMRALSMRPTREIAAAVVEKVREEEAELPPAQRRTQQELADMVGVDRSTLANRDGSRSAPRVESRQPDLEPVPVAMPARQDEADIIASAIDDHVAAKADVADAMDAFLPPDAEAPRRAWNLSFLTAMRPAFKLMAQFKPEAVAESADDECLDELVSLAKQMQSYLDRVRTARPVPDNVRHLRAV